jgi:high-affinity Fe2+/Pb2+ permease
MTDLDLLIAGAMVTFLAVAGAYIAIRHRANETPVESFKQAGTQTYRELKTTAESAEALR